MRLLRKQDTNAEHCFSSYLQKYLYPKLELDSFCRTDFYKDQIGGVDVWLEKHGHCLAVDEKLAAHYLNTKKDNFVLELVTPKGNPGWFLNDDLKTDVYAFIWGRLDEKKFPFQQNERRNDYFKTMKETDITGALVMFIRKSALRNWFAQKGFTSDFLYKSAVSMRRMPTKKKIRWKTMKDRNGKELYGVKGMALSLYLDRSSQSSRLALLLSVCSVWVLSPSLWTATVL